MDWRGGGQIIAGPGCCPSDLSVSCKQFTFGDYCGLWATVNQDETGVSCAGPPPGLHSNTGELTPRPCGWRRDEEAAHIGEIQPPFDTKERNRHRCSS